MKNPRAEVYEASTAVLFGPMLGHVAPYSWRNVVLKSFWALSPVSPSTRGAIGEKRGMLSTPTRTVIVPVDDRPPASVTSKVTEISPLSVMVGSI